ncbi:MAG: radical SAM protein [Thermoguttaceae bacterium]|nr:radical SAM protein [Thermoguttaceae bacterium]
MELPQRPKDDRFVPAGAFRRLCQQIAGYPGVDQIPVLFVYAFDPRTRLGPFYLYDKVLIPGAPRSVAAALHAAGFRRIRVVLQSWNPRLRPSLARLDGDIPQLLLISSMQIHSQAAYDLIVDAWSLGENRPLILAGGPKAIYEPWDFFGLGLDGSQGVDVAVTGEEYVLLELLDRILAHRLPGQSLRHAFELVRREGLLTDIPGLVYRPDNEPGPPQALVSTGPQRLVKDLDELPPAVTSLAYFEPPHPRRELSQRPLPVEQLCRHAKIVTILNTRGCHFRCHYCPIPAYNQFSFRTRSPESLIEEIVYTRSHAGIRTFFGADDNFFNDRGLLERTFQAMAQAKVGQEPFRDAIFFSTEATVFDVHKHQDLIPLAREAGLRALWIGVEDLTGTLVKKGQGPEKTRTVFQLLRKAGIAPMAMIIHHDGQPLWTWKGLYGLLNQVNFLRRAGALTCQITLLTPSVGSKTYEKLFEEGKVLRTVGGKPVEDYQYDGNHCIATASDRPWIRQLNIFLGYAAFYNPVNFLRGLFQVDHFWRTRLECQLLGMTGVVGSLVRARKWLARLIAGKIERYTAAPQPRFPVLTPSWVCPQPVLAPAVGD